MAAEPFARWVGQLVLGGFAGAELPERYGRALREGRRGGAILFKRNLPSIDTARELAASIAAACPEQAPPLIGVDQEGGRVVRLPAPALSLPPMRELGRQGDDDLVAAAGTAVGSELAAIGFNINFAPVLDVDTEPKNPVIGDRAFGRDPARVARLAVAYLQGLQGAGVLACGKHFPGHGDTHLDSHHALPSVTHDRQRLAAVEFAPFRAAIAAGVAGLMSAHVVYSALDPTRPGTLSARVCQDLLRDELGFTGLLFSDDLEMKALASFGTVAEVAVEAVSAGCDAVLVCSDEDAQEAVVEALAREAERDTAFAARCRESLARLLPTRRAHPPRPAATEQLRSRVGGSASAAFAQRLSVSLASSRPAER